MKGELVWFTDFLLSEADHLFVHWLTSWVLFDELFVHFYCLKKKLKRTEYMCMGLCLLWHGCGGHRTAVGSQFSPSALWVLGMLDCTHPYPLSHPTALYYNAVIGHFLKAFFGYFGTNLRRGVGWGGRQICSLFTPRLGFSLSAQRLPSPRSLKFQSPGNYLAIHLHVVFFPFLFKSYFLA